MTEATQAWDVAVIGGGPAGSTAATLLAKRGYRVRVLEKARHPRFHIGESLLPANLRLFEQLGVADEVRRIGMVKLAAEFVSPQHDGRMQRFLFADAWDKSMPSAYQVRRSELDDILLRNAARHGAEVSEGCRAREVVFNPDGASATIHAEHDDGRSETVQARFVVDASGRDTLLANHFRTKRRNERHNSSALYAHFRHAQRNPGENEGNITVFWFEHGWFWFIPLVDGTTSIGAVVWPAYLKQRPKGTSVEAFFRDTIALCAPLAERLKDAELVSEVHATGNYSYTGEMTHGPNFLLLGDAFAFIDPVFSSGVMLAMQSAFAGAEAIDTALAHPARAQAALAKFDRDVRHGPREFSWFIYRMTSPTMRNLFMGPRNPLRMKEALLSLLAGDIFGKTPIWHSLRAFKGIYYVSAAIDWRNSLRAWRMRRRNLSEAEHMERPAN
ncbi:NAD(P)/FAD-dependent oxidoreductase [Caballeronia sp. LZ035]|uniref:NAD(P)/FAD-dependent oxidoreductase n=1 Tax=Caballeronia sp. LZ035 TaxID=3038568 RepID=UPI002861C6FF|nr:NAD(P)/FAD-dependent oxidoreductase [Caballeronia sp. LZ035]MDR5760461.1 NAD(P)/FAD-dependent oxidoreductase [Caballeronia sp. LZ035]